MNDPSASIRVALVLSSEHWQKKSIHAVAKHCGVSMRLVKKIRDELGLKTDAVQCANGRVIRTRQIGRRSGSMQRKLTHKQQELIAQAEPLAQRLAKKYANEVLDEDELLGVAHVSLNVIVRHWKQEKKREWLNYAREGIEISFRRAFANARKRLRKEGLFRSNDEHEQFALDQLAQVNIESEGEILADRFRSLTGLKRVVTEWIAGLDGSEPRNAEEIARFWNIPVSTAKEIIQEAKEAMLD